MYEYNIEDLIKGEDDCYDTTNGLPTTNNKNMKTILEERKFNKFLDSGKVEKVEKLIEKSNIKQIRLYEIASSILNISNLLETDTEIVESAINNGDINLVESASLSLSTQLKVVDNKKLNDALDFLSSLFGIEEEKTESTKEIENKVTKAYGFKNTK